MVQRLDQLLFTARRRCASRRTGRVA
jgi:hypothetical protein